MYSDNHFDDVVFDNDIPAMEFDINAAFELTGQSYHDNNNYSAYSNPLLESAPRNNTNSSDHYSMHYGGGDDFESLLNQGMLKSPQPSTVKKLKSHLDGVGVGGGYLTSPMGTSRVATNSQYNISMNAVAGPSPTKSSPVKPMYEFQQLQPLQQQIDNSVTGMPQLSSQPMQRLRSAPAAFQQQQQPSSSSMQPSSSFPSTSAANAAAGPSTRRKASSKAVNNSSKQQQQPASSNAGLGIPGAGFSELDYGSMRIYGRPLERSASADQSTSTSSGKASSSFLPYPEHLPTITLGRGVKNARNVADPTEHEVFPQVKEERDAPTGPVMKQSNIEKPYIQYVPPNSPAAKSAARNKNKLSINTGTSANGKASTKLVPIRMTPKKEMPLTPPITAASMSSPGLVPVPQHSPSKRSYDYSGVGSMQSIPMNMPSFEFSLEQFGTVEGGEYGQQYRGGTEDHMDLATMLGLPTPGIDSCSSVTSSSGILSPGPLSSTSSSHSSVFSAEQALMYGIPQPSPSFFEPTDSNSIDQALASLLEGNQLNHNQQQQQYGFQPMQQQQQQTDLNSWQQQQQQIHELLSPRHQAQAALGLSSPPRSPRGPASPARMPQWSPYNQSHSQLQSSIDPALQQMHQSNLLLSPSSNQQYNSNLLLSPQGSQYNSNYQNITVGGRPMSSPRRLQGMRSAPDLGAMYQEQNQQFNNALSPSQRKVSLKRDRAYYDSEEEDDDGFGYGNGNGQDDSFSESQGDEEYQPSHLSAPPAKRRSVSAALQSSASSSGSLFPMVNPNPSRLRPGPKPKTSCPNLQAAYQSVFVVEPNAPPVPNLPISYASSAASPNPDLLGVPLNSVTKDLLASFYTIGCGSKQTKKGRPQRMYICSIPGCGKEFPRKSAVESHIQTHLEDKPFACPYDECGASFVRSHDLTRHVRIHSGSKPFECACGKGFARGDALTRHRQRGICEGSLVPRRW